MQNERNDEDLRIMSKKIYGPSKDLEYLFVEKYQGIEKVRKGHYAFYSDGPVARILIPKMFEPHEICETRAVQYLNNTFAGVMVNKNSPFRKRLLINWLWINEVGIVFKTKKHWQAEPLHCISRTHFKQVSFQYIAIALLFLVFLYVLSLIILCIEIYLAKVY